MNRPTEKELMEAADYQDKTGLPPNPERCYTGTGGVVIHPGELGDLFNLLQDNPRPWNRRLRRVIAAWMLHLMAEGKLTGEMEYYQP